MMYPKKNIETIFVKNFSGSLDVSDEIFDVLKILDQDLILWRKNDQELIVFTKGSWDKFFKLNQDKFGLSDIQLKYSKKGSMLITFLNHHKSGLICKNNKLVLSDNNILLKYLKGKDCSVNFCL